ncbi:MULTISPECIES: SCO4226 family nickel-binding protein [Streptomyces]|uniref:SCO4226 family nickel-binding protein n=1 Tax=Streptomyces TaxID=1883 RepID=UPI000CF22EE4|nr:MULTISPECIES: SCO4226 family nickel-binding protein [Streptomyces]PPS68104.1 gualylate cyclase [Streptomyces sp. 46]
MPKFMDVHRGMEGITEEQLREAHNADLAIEKDEQVHFETAWADPESGHVYCLSEAPSAEAVQRIHERAGHKADEVHPVPLTVR